MQTKVLAGILGEPAFSQALVGLIALGFFKIRVYVTIDSNHPLKATPHVTTHLLEGWDFTMGNRWRQHF